ncbi:MAG TPA: nitrogenase iron-molybdenum cofactor biosynthesis protein NifE [Humidesulfovibrio sp.]|uniref:nitrogenase iron-molybdenum cofactor biosynthesis protein NifE n=1 Tax=Humidesulfovibrio sp. TaxID=2910988 RepID=UPI002B54219B|nr:nitrogenase iron-molybdenum cofactor biosynthesis protein NifE [Humidesulfovibrio sp.]HWR03384.1 nitrogenase iron-molybdenum cofactor biosynthesis protein NifE [Humidesulfovibrio sp.]
MTSTAKAITPERASIFEERKDQIHRVGEADFSMACNRDSLAGAVSQRACVFCGSRVVLYPIADALHLVHGPIGCAAYTWDIRGALSSGPELHRLSFSTDLQELDVVFGGEKKLAKALDELITRYSPKAAFVYSTCIVGLIGDDLQAVCKAASARHGIPVIPVQSEGFKGNKREGYMAACKAMRTLVGTGDVSGISPLSVNIMGDFNLAGETWIIKDYLTRMGIEVVAGITGDGRVDDLRRAHGASLNLVQCSGSTQDLAKMMRDDFGIPFVRVSWIGIEDVAESLYAVAEHFELTRPDLAAGPNGGLVERTAQIVREELASLMPKLAEYRRDLEGKRAAVYVGGSFKAFSLVKAFRHLGMEVVIVGSQTGTEEEYKELAAICAPGTIVVDDANPLELSAFIKEKDVDIFVGGVKERPIAFKLGVGFCDHNHERKIALEGFVGMLNFAKEVHASVMSPIWRFVPRREMGLNVSDASTATGVEV